MLQQKSTQLLEVLQSPFDFPHTLHSRCFYGKGRIVLSKGVEQRLLRWNHLCQHWSQSHLVRVELVVFKTERCLLDQKGWPALAALSLRDQRVKLFLTDSLVVYGFGLMGSRSGLLAALFLVPDVRLHL